MIFLGKKSQAKVIGNQKNVQLTKGTMIMSVLLFSEFIHQAMLFFVKSCSLITKIG